MGDNLPKLIKRGDYIAIEQGRLVIRPKSNKPVPTDWLKKNQTALLAEIANCLGVPIYQYERYTTGSYSVAGDNSKLGAGVMLHYLDLLTRERPCVTFNVLLTRGRTTQHGKQGSLLPKGKFRVSRESTGRAFLAYWCSLNLPLPTRLSMFHDYMGKLKTVLITGRCLEGGKLNSKKLDKSTIEPLTMTYEQIAKAVKLPDNRLTTPLQVPDNSLFWLN